MFQNFQMFKANLDNDYTVKLHADPIYLTGYNIRMYIKRTFAFKITDGNFGR